MLKIIGIFFLAKLIILVQGLSFSLEGNPVSSVKKTYLII